MKTLTSQQAADRLGLSKRQLTRWIAAGKLTGAFKVNPDFAHSPYVIPEEAVEEIEKQRKK